MQLPISFARLTARGSRPRLAAPAQSSSRGSDPMTQTMGPFMEEDDDGRRSVRPSIEYDDAESLLDFVENHHALQIEDLIDEDGHSHSFRHPLAVQPHPIMELLDADDDVDGDDDGDDDDFEQLPDIVTLSPGSSIQIWVTREIEQTHEIAPFDITGLLALPRGRQAWCSVAVPTRHHTNPNGDWVKLGLLLPGGMHTVGASPDGRRQEVALDPAYLPWLRENGFAFEVDACHWDVVPSVESRIEMGAGDDVAYAAYARDEAAFLLHSAKGVLSAASLGLGLFLRDRVPSTLRAPIEWAILGRDLIETSPEIRTTFAQAVVFLTLNTLREDDLEGEPTTTLLARDANEVITRAHRLCVDKATARVDEAPTDQHSVALLRALLGHSGGRDDAIQHDFDPACSAADSLGFLAAIVDVVDAVDTFLGGYEEKRMRALLARSRAFHGVDVDGLDLGKYSAQLAETLPIAGLAIRDLPPSVGAKLDIGHVQWIRNHMNDLYNHHPSLNRRENDVLVLLTWCSIAPPVQELREWSASHPGRQLYRDLLEAFTKHQPLEMLVLRLGALIGYRHLMRAFTDIEGVHPLYGSFMRDLHAIIKGGSLWNEAAVMERMGFSCLRALEALEYRKPLAVLLGNMLGARAPLMHPLDGFSDHYWNTRLDSHYPHDQAFGEVEGLEDEATREWLPFTRSGRRGLHSPPRYGLR